MVLSILSVFLLFILVIGIHELGHALSARIFNIKIKRISLGFGKPLLLWSNHKGTEWAWSMWPLGGYVQLLNSRISPVEPTELQYCFDKKPIWMRVIVLLSGCIANVLVAWLLLILVNTVGFDSQVAKVQTVTVNGPAAQAGIKAEDQIISVGQANTPTWREVGMELIIHWGSENLAVSVQNSNQQIQQLTIDLSHIPFNDKTNSLLNSLGIIPDFSVAKLRQGSPNILMAIQKSNETIIHLVYFFVMVLKQLFMGIIPFSVLIGPFGILVTSVVSFMQGIIIFLFFIATLSIAVALVNLFPIPGLDGGSIVFAFLEKIRGKPISVALEILLHRLVTIAFCVLLIQLILNDLQRFLIK